jgi:hypothetical protein
LSAEYNALKKQAIRATLLKRNIEAIFSLAFALDDLLNKRGKVSSNKIRLQDEFKDTKEENENQ